MGILNRIKRIDVGDGDWIDVHPLSVEEVRTMQRSARAAKVASGEEKDEAEGFFMLAAARKRIVGWSDEAKVTPENVDKISVDMNSQVLRALVEVAELPLTSGSASTDT